MKNRHALPVILPILLLTIAIPSVFLVREYRREQASRELIAAIKVEDTNRALAALKNGADPNIRTLEDVSYDYDPALIPVHIPTLSERVNAFVDKVFHKNSDSNRGLTVLLLCLDENRKENPRLMEALIRSGANPNLANEYGTTPMMVACRTDHMASLKVLLQCGDVSLKDSEGSTAMNYAAESDNADAMLLLAQAGADVNNPDKYGRSPLHTVCVNDNIEAVHTLLAYHANPNARDWNGKTPLDFSLEFYEDQSNLVKTLRKAGAKTSKELDARAATSPKH